MAAALETDPLFRQRIGEKLREAQPELAGALESGSPPAAADPLDVAAAAYVLRPAGWVKLVAAAGEEAQRADAERVDEESRRELERLREELAEARDADPERDRAAAHRAGRGPQGSGIASPQAAQRAVSDVKRGEAALRKLHAEIEDPRAEAAAQVSAAESETRRLKSRLGEVEAALEASPPGRPRGAQRSRTCGCGCCWTPCWTRPRGCAASWPCRRCPYAPADTVDAVEPGRMTPKDIAARALSETDPALLDQLLALPQAHLVVDGYNVTKTGYPTMPLEKQRLRLLGRALDARRADRRRDDLCLRRGRAGRPGAARAAARGAGAVLQGRGDRGRADPPAGARGAAGAAGGRRLHRPRGRRRGGQGGGAAGRVRVAC